jgi:hypothetical protein
METRIAYMKVAPGAYKAMLGLEEYLHQCGLDHPCLIWSSFGHRR